VFEIGNSLREARVRQGVDFPELEQATKIRGKYLRALEDENFEQLPGQTYVKGFLRTYADYLGLDGQLYVDEYNSRYVTGEEEPVRVRGGSSSLGPHRLQSSAVLIALTAIGIATALVIAAWHFGAPDTRATLPALDGTTTKQTRTKQTPAKTRPAARGKQVRLVVRAVRGDSWLKVHRGGPTGAIEYEGTLFRGQSQPFQRKALWVTIGVPANVALRLNGRNITVPASDSPVDYLVNRKGIRPVT
jgi:hypothetical protein